MSPPGLAPAPSNTGRPAVNRVSKTQRHRLALALVKLTHAAGEVITHREAREVVNDHVRSGETPDEIEAYLRTTFRSDPTGVTAVRNVARERAGR